MGSSEADHACRMCNYDARLVRDRQCERGSTPSSSEDSIHTIETLNLIQTLCSRARTGPHVHRFDHHVRVQDQHELHCPLTAVSK